jgi:hypothetical protein
MVALLSLHDNYVYLSTAREREHVKACVMILAPHFSFPNHHMLPLLL